MTANNKIMFFSGDCTITHHRKNRGFPRCFITKPSIISCTNILYASTLDIQGSKPI